MTVGGDDHIEIAEENISMDKKSIIKHERKVRSKKKRRYISCTQVMKVEIEPADIYMTLKQTKLEKWFPLQGERGHSSYFRSFQK